VPRHDPRADKELRARRADELSSRRTTAIAACSTRQLGCYGGVCAAHVPRTLKM